MNYFSVIIIGHLKSDFRLARNYLKGTIGDAISLLPAATAFNCKKWMNTLAEGLLFVLVLLHTLIRENGQRQINCS